MYSKPVRIVLTALSLSIFLILGIGSSDSSSENPSGNSRSSESSMVDLNASVRFTGTQFIITNNDDFNWHNVELDVNSGTFKSGYLYDTSIMLSGQTYKIGAAQFAKKDGTRFNPFKMKPQNITITCELDNNRDGFYYATW